MICYVNKLFNTFLVLMLHNNMIDLFDDATLPDLLLAEEPLYSEAFKIDDLVMPPPHPQIAELSRKIESLTIEVNTQGLQLEIERTKRQRLQSTVRQLKRDIVAPCPDLLAIQNDLVKFKGQQEATNYMLDGENARTNTLAFRSISRICQLLTAMMPSASVSPDAVPEVNILLHELLLTVQQFGVHYAASYV